MGGDREFAAGGQVAATPRPAVEVGPPPPVPVASQQDQHVRVHENAGEVHFHVDSEKLKAAVPVASWYEAWQELSTIPGKTFTWSDEANGTLLKVESVQTDDEIDARITVQKIKIGDTFAQLSKFSSP